MSLEDYFCKYAREWWHIRWIAESSFITNSFPRADYTCIPVTLFKEYMDRTSPFRSLMPNRNAQFTFSNLNLSSYRRHRHQAMQQNIFKLVKYENNIIIFDWWQSKANSAIRLVNTLFSMMFKGKFWSAITSAQWLIVFMTLQNYRVNIVILVISIFSGWRFITQLFISSTKHFSTAEI